jgi:hypothetical protein
LVVGVFGQEKESFFILTFGMIWVPPQADKSATRMADEYFVAGHLNSPVF